MYSDIVIEGANSRIIYFDRDWGFPGKWKEGRADNLTCIVAEQNSPTPPIAGNRELRSQVGCFHLLCQV